MKHRLLFVLAFGALAALLTILFAAAGRADEFHQGAQGFYYKEGGTTPYFRHKEYTWNQGYYGQPGYWTYTWAYSEAPVYHPPAAAEKVPAYADADWQKKLLEVVRERDSLNAYQQALKMLGLPAPPAGGYAGSYGGAYSTTTSYGVPTGATLYGYSLNQFRDYSSPLDVNVAFQQAARLVQGAQGLAGDGFGQLNQTIQAGADAQARVAEIRARGDALARIAERLTPPETTTTTVTGQAGAALGQAPDATAAGPLNQNAQGLLPGAPPGDRLDDGAFVSQVLAPSCLGCHGGTQPKAGLDLTGYLKLPPDKKALVWSRLFTADESKRMPPKEKGPLPANVLKQFLR